MSQSRCEGEKGRMGEGEGGYGGIDNELEGPYINSNWHSFTTLDH